MEIYTRLSRYFPDQFREPKGMLGNLVGWLEMRRNEPQNDFTLAALEVGPGERILELGYGPGVSLSKLMKQTGSGWVAGIDYSPVMARKAYTRNRAAIQQGRVRLTLGDICRLPFPDNLFDKTLMVSVIYFLKETTNCLKELYRTQRPGGRIAIYLTARNDLIEAEFPVLGGYLMYEPEELQALLSDAGYGRTWFRTRQINGRTGICVLAEKGR